MHTRSRVFTAVSVIALGGLGNVIAQSDFTLSQATAVQARGPRHQSSSSVAIAATGTGGFGDPLPGLTAAQLADFAEGLDDFKEADDAASGLGPVFNDVSCVACHSFRAPGGASAVLETRFGRLVNGNFFPLAPLGGSLLQLKAIDPGAQERLPLLANVVAQRLTTPLFGAGLIEAIPDAAIMLNATTQRADGISGRVSVVQDVATGQTRVGRFGWKSQQATLLAFAGDAYLNEIGITSRLFPQENAPNGSAALLAKYDLVADPEDVVDPATGKADIDHFADFMRFLAPPPPLNLTTSARAGKDLFNQTGCDSCHVPTMTTGPSSIQALDRKSVPLYSDLLLHDMGSLGDGIAQGTAHPNEMRTAPLWGLRARGPFLHDGRAASVDAAIRAHDGEAALVRNRYNHLTTIQQRQLVEFLNSI